MGINSSNLFTRKFTITIVDIGSVNGICEGQHFIRFFTYCQKKKWYVSIRKASSFEIEMNCQL